jgi:CheY-like chemotaxis protein
MKLTLTHKARRRHTLQSHAEFLGEGEERRSLVREHWPQAITLDVMMPQMDGWAALKELKADAELRDSTPGARRSPIIRTKDYFLPRVWFQTRVLSENPIRPGFAS